MEKQTGNLYRRLIKSCFGILIAILLGLATNLITPTGPAFASARVPSAAPLPRIASPSAADACLDKTKRYVDCGNGSHISPVAVSVTVRRFPSSE